MELGGIVFRFTDTAGLRETTDTIEAMGVERTKDRMKKASLILYRFDLVNMNENEIEEEEAHLNSLNIPYLKVGNKMDKLSSSWLSQLQTQGFILISASEKKGIEELKTRILELFQISSIKQGDVVVTNLRHFQNLNQTYDALDRVLTGMKEGITGDFFAMDIRQSLHYLGEITGQITTDDLWKTFF